MCDGQLFKWMCVVIRLSFIPIHQRSFRLHQLRSSQPPSSALTGLLRLGRERKEERRERQGEHGRRVCVNVLSTYLVWGIVLKLIYVLTYPRGGGTTTYITIYYCYVYCKRENQIIKQLSQVEPKSTCFYPRAKSQRNTKDFVFCLCRAFKILRLKTQSLYLLLLKSIGLS